VGGLWIVCYILLILGVCVMNPDGVGNFGMSYVKEPFTIFSGICELLYMVSVSCHKL
jgi:hypothetical protein